MRLPLVLAGLLLTGAAGASPASAASGCPLPVFSPGTGYHPQVSPPDFSPDVNNPWFPLTPGRTLVYTGTKDGKRSFDLVAPSGRTKVIDGVTTRVVEDHLFLGGRLAERTSDYYAQDRCGDVWYFGEDTAELDRRGHVTNREGSFHAGEGGAQPGVVMQARPELGRRFRQEWFRGHAEDRFKAVDLSARVSVGHRRFSGVLRTHETTPLEPKVLDEKLYAKGVGELTERAVKGPRETLRLVEIIG
jgi:hypothetical protein